VTSGVIKNITVVMFEITRPSKTPNWCPRASSIPAWNANGCLS